ncbi:MAG: beta-N-acetylhexosaminidase [Alphaproteobacteria bacterium]|nr:MAG: beta-N-acetylhexosaminidase [Alphaproteobacteria bacterium]
MRSTAPSRPPRAVIFGVAGTELLAEERAFFSEVEPLGFILFQRNCRDADQIRRLVSDLRETVGRPDAPVLIDQEGGRVQRLKPPHWRAAPPAARFGAVFSVDPDRAIAAARLNGRLIAQELSDLGITVNCAPVLDVPVPGAHDVIGDRAFGTDISPVMALGRAFAEGLRAGGVLPIWKHIPGHGRARVDSHRELPRVDADTASLSDTDFTPFREIAANGHSQLGWAMTAHIVYADVDPDRPATLSPTVIDQVIRGAIDFQGVLVTDDVCMDALTGDFADRAAASLAAGCDIVLHCSGRLEEMQAVARGTRRVSEPTQLRLARAAAALPKPSAFDVAGGEADLERLIAA